MDIKIERPDTIKDCPSCDCHDQADVILTITPWFSTVPIIKLPLCYDCKQNLIAAMENH